MRKFLTHTIGFGLIFVSGIILITLASNIATKLLIDFKINKNKNTLLLGNSHIQFSINDKDLPKVKNMGQSGSSYFYEYLKIKEISKTNKHIDTLILGYTYQDLAPKMDAWLTGKEKLKFKVRSHLYLFHFSDYWNLLKLNPVDVLANTPQTIIYNFLNIKNAPQNIGGYKKLERSELKKALKKLESETPPLAKKGYSKHQLKYLSKIYAYCVQKNIKLILLGTPIHKKEIAFYKNYINFYEKYPQINLPKATLVNHADFQLPDTHFADRDHINYHGAKIYTSFLKETLFSRCP